MDKKNARERLLNYKNELIKLNELASESHATVKLDQQSVGRLSRMDALQQQAMANATKARRQSDLNRIEHMLTMIENDEYGYCEQCGEQIPEKRLEVDPLAIRCIHCAG